jgi:thiamine kinase-like enzyme
VPVKRRAEPREALLPQELLQAVQKLLPGAEGPVTGGELGEGLSNRSFWLKTPTEDWVVRRAATDQTPALLDLPTEFDVLRRVADAGLGPKPRACDAELGLLASERLPDAYPWIPALAAQPANIARLAERLRALHALAPPALPAYRPDVIADRYLHSVRARRRLSAEHERWRDELAALARGFVEQYAPSALCHNDLVAENILDDGAELWFVDFEYATLAHPILDLAGVVAMNGFARAEQRQLLAAYYAPGAVPLDTDAFRSVVRMLRLLAHFWSLAAQGPSGKIGARGRFATRMAQLIRQDEA